MLEAMELAFGMLALIFGVYCIWYEIGGILENRRITVGNLFLLMYGVTYGVILALILFLDSCFGYQVTGIRYGIDYTGRGILYLFVWFLFAVAGYVMVRFGSRITLREKKENAPRLPDRDVPVAFQWTAVICLVVGGVCFYLWARGWGGIRNLILNAASIRNGSYAGKNSMAYFAKPAQVVTAVSVMCILLCQRGYHRGWNGVLAVLSVGLSLLYLLAKDGRMGMAMYILVVLFVLLGLFEENEHVLRKFRTLIPLFLLFVFVVLTMNSVTYFIRNGHFRQDSTGSVGDTVLKELMYIYASGQAAVKQLLTSRSPLLIFHDLGKALFAWVPSALTPNGLVDIWKYNTQLVGGSAVKFQIPCDLITTSLYDLGMLGPILIPAFWGKVITWLEERHQAHGGMMSQTLYYASSMQLVRLVNYCCLHYSVAAVFHLALAWGVYRLLCRRKSGGVEEPQ